MRRLAIGLRGLLASLPDDVRRRQALLSRLDRRDAERERGRETGARAHPRAATSRPETVVRLVRGESTGRRRTFPAPTACASRSEALAEGGSGRRAAARSSRGSPSARARESARSTSAPPRAGRRRSSRARSSPSRSTRARARELEENARPARRDQRPRRLRRRRSTCRPSSAASIARSSTHRAPGSGCSTSGPISAGASKPLPELQLALLRAAAERVRRGGTIVYSVCTLNADENEAVVDASGLRIEDLGAEWPAFAHPDRPEFLLTLPHVHGTAGFFIARLRIGPRIPRVEPLLERTLALAEHGRATARPNPVVGAVSRRTGSRRRGLARRGRRPACRGRGAATRETGHVARRST